MSALLVPNGIKLFASLRPSTFHQNVRNVRQHCSKGSFRFLKTETNTSGPATLLDCYGMLLRIFGTLRYRFVWRMYNSIWSEYRTPTAIGLSAIYLNVRGLFGQVSWLRWVHFPLHVDSLRWSSTRKVKNRHPVPPRFLRTQVACWGEKHLPKIL